MGLPEFYNPIKSSVDEIKASTITIENLVTQLQQTDVASLSTKVDGIGIKAYPNRHYHATGLSAPNGSTVLLNITGKQGIVYFAFGGTATGNTGTGLKITIDGVVVIDPAGKTISTAYWQGLIPIMGGATSYLRVVGTDRSPNFEINTNGIPMGEGIHFNDSLKIEWVNLGSTAGMQYSFDVRVK